VAGPMSYNSGNWIWILGLYETQRDLDPFLYIQATLAIKFYQIWHCRYFDCHSCYRNYFEYIK